MYITLDQLKPGQGACVTGIFCGPNLVCRLAEFGLIPGTRVCCRYLSPDRKTSALQVRGAVLALRLQDLRSIQGRLL